MFKRKIYDKMLEWKNDFSESYALMIEGPRRVGKTTLAKEFASKEFRSFLFIDFSVAPKEAKEAFVNHPDDYDMLFFRLQSIYGVTLYEHESAVVFDEIQAFPPARQAIKHLVEDGRYRYIETGSLISIKKNVRDIVIPSEEMNLKMHPMDFEEFLWAIGKTKVPEQIKKAFEDRASLGIETHKSIMRLFYTYMLVGGMPQSVNAFVSGKSPKTIDEIKRQILIVYKDDMVKFGELHGTKARLVFEGIPYALSKHEKSFSPSDIKKNTVSKTYMKSINWLEQSRTVNICRRCTDPGPALDMTIDEYAFKIYMADTGLLTSLSLESNLMDKNELYDTILNGRLGINEGMFFENIVAQELAANDRKLIYVKFYTEESENIQEVDFVLVSGNRVLPIEVKSGVSSKHKSLDRFAEKYSKRVRESYVIHAKDLKTEGNVVYIPAYMTMCL